MERLFSVGGIFRDITKRKEAEEALQSVHDELEIRVQERTAELAKANQALNAEVDERILTEIALKVSETRLESLFETMSEGVVLIAPDGQIVLANPAAENILGLTRYEIGSRNYIDPEWEIFRVDGTPMPPEEMAGPRAMKERRPVRDNVMGIKRPYGSISWINVSAAPLITKDGTIDGVVGTFADITERKNAMDALHESEEKYRVLFEMAKDAIFLSDESGRIVDVNEAACDSLGYSKEELLKLSNREIDADPRGYEAFLKVWDGLAEEVAFEVNQRRKDGTLLPVEIAGCSFTCRGQRIALAIARDISERKQNEEETAVSLGEREVLLKEIHHRIKNNLQIVSSLLDMHSLRTSDQQAVDLLKEARAKIHAMALIHSQLYQSDRLAQVNMGGYIYELFDHLSHVYANMKKSVASDIEHSDVYLTISQAIPCALVLHELTSNAFKHAFKDRQKGGIKISVRESANDKVSIIVEDDGIGIPEEIDVYKTDTMGLKLVRNLVLEQLKGSITVKRDNGTKFFIEFENVKEEGRICIE